MPQTNLKTCPGCQQLFECKAETLEICQCSSVFLTQEEREYIQKRYDDCLCTDCLKRLKKECEKAKTAETDSGSIKSKKKEY